MANHSIVYNARIIGIVEKNGRCRVDLYVEGEDYADRAFYPAAVDLEEDPKKARQILADIEKIDPSELNDFVIEDFSGVSRKTGRAFRICKLVGVFDRSGMAQAGNDV